jgi:hypothetical protein
MLGFRLQIRMLADRTQLMRLPTILKIVFTVLYGLWVAVMFLSMPPEGIVETIGVLAFAAVIFVAGYYFHLFVLRGAIRAVAKKSDKG